LHSKSCTVAVDFSASMSAGSVTDSFSCIPSTGRKRLETDYHSSA
jgi:hypothetical protein